MADEQELFAGSVTACLAIAHDFAMSKDPAMACQGRLVKQVANLIDRFMTDERARGSTPSDVVCAARAAGLGLAVSVLANSVRPGHAAAAADLMREDILASWDRSTAHLRKLGI